MPWGKVDDNFYDHPKVDRLPPRDRLPAIGLHWLAVSWCNRYLTDGAVPADRVPRLGGTRHLAMALVAADLWEDSEDGYQIHDYLDYNQSRDQVERLREQRAAAGRAGGMAKRRASEKTSGPPSKSSSKSSSGSVGVGYKSDEPPTRPVPSDISIGSTTPPGYKSGRARLGAANARDGVER